MAFAVAFILLFLPYSEVEGTFGLLYPQFSGSYISPIGKYHNNGWIGLSGIKRFPSIQSHAYDTLNSEYSHALYPFDKHHFIRIPVKGGLTVVPAPKHLASLKGISTYEEHPHLKHIPFLKKPPLNYYGGLHLSGHSHFLKNLEKSLSSTDGIGKHHSLISGLHLTSHIPLLTKGHLDDVSHIGFSGYKSLEGIKSIHGGHSYSTSHPIIKSHGKHFSSLISSHHKDHSLPLISHHQTSHIEDSDIEHDLPHSHHSVNCPHLKHTYHSNSEHDLSHIHHSDIEHDSPHSHHSDIEHDSPHSHHPDIEHDSPHSHHSDIEHDLPHSHHSHNEHDLPHSHHSDIEHDSPHSHHSHIEHDLPHIHHSGIEHDLPHSHHTDIEDDLPHSHHSHIEDDLPHSHLSDIRHELTHSHHSDIEDELPYSHHSDADHDLPHIHKSNIGHGYQHIHDSSHSNIDHHNVHDEVVEDHKSDIHEQHSKPLHGTHEEKDHDSYPKEELAKQVDKSYSPFPSTQHKIDDVPSHKVSHKGTVKDYPTSRNVEKYPDIIRYEKKNEKVDYIPHAHKGNVKLPNHGYNQKKIDVNFHSEKGTYKIFQTNRHRSNVHQIKDFRKLHNKHQEHHMARGVEPYPRFPNAPKITQNYDAVKYAGGRHPVRPIIRQTHYNSEEPLKHEVFSVEKHHKSYDKVPPKIEQHEEHYQHDDYKSTSGNTDHLKSYNNEQKQHSYTESKRPEHVSYKSGSSLPRGRTKIYRNYEKPRTSSYEIEILHSESSDYSKDAPVEKVADVPISHLNPEELDSYAPEEIADEHDGFDYQESQLSLSEEKADEKNLDDEINPTDKEE